jgi:cbb3-type cytochrome oxidase subunit 3
VLEALTGLGLSTSAGLNAYIPMLGFGVVARYTDVVSLPSSWQWLENPWVLGILGLLLAVEFVADKVPAVDHANDVLQTVIRPTSGGIVFGAAANGDVTVTDPEAFFTSGAWVPVAMGIGIALAVHLVKAALRAVVNAATFGLGAPVVSLGEDTFAVGMTLAALIVPILVLMFLAVLIAVAVWGFRRRRRRRAEAAAAALTG